MDGQTPTLLLAAVDTVSITIMIFSALLYLWTPQRSTGAFVVVIFIFRVAGEIICLVASVCVLVSVRPVVCMHVCVSIRLTVGALQFEPFDLLP